MEFLLIKFILVVVVFAVSLGIAAYSTYAERKIAAFLQDRVGPDRAGPFGLLQPLADGVKMFMKEEIIPTNADKRAVHSWTMYHDDDGLYDRCGYPLGKFTHDQWYGIPGSDY
jgi:NADH:ubiquinone oxidoreductase subunit H